MAVDIVLEQMEDMRSSGLLDAASQLIVGINGGKESYDLANLVLPVKAKRIMHGLDSCSENLTIVEIEKFVKTNPLTNVLYFHSKGATQKEMDPLRTGWRRCMMRNLVINWARCVNDLEFGYDSVGCHWFQGRGVDLSQNYWAGNFWWAKGSFLWTLPSIMERARIKMSGIRSLESRYEAEVWIGNGKTLPSVKDYHKADPTFPGICI